MKENILGRVGAEKLESLLDALTGVIGEMDGTVPGEERYGDEGYVSCFYLRTEVLVALKRKMEVERLKDNTREA